MFKQCPSCKAEILEQFTRDDGDVVKRFTCLSVHSDHFGFEHRGRHCMEVLIEKILESLVLWRTVAVFYYESMKDLQQYIPCQVINAINRLKELDEWKT